MILVIVVSGVQLAYIILYYNKQLKEQIWVLNISNNFKEIISNNIMLMKLQV